MKGKRGRITPSSPHMYTQWKDAKNVVIITDNRRNGILSLPLSTETPRNECIAGHSASFGHFGDLLGGG